MAKIWTDILVPVVIVGAVAAQTVGVEVSRASRLRSWFPRFRPDTVEQVAADTQKALARLRPDSLALPADTLSVADSLLPAADSLTDAPKVQKDTLEEEEFDLFGEPEDTTPKVFARDTMKVPDSLKLTDPFLYEWYVATKDGYTHRLVVDSLKAEGDSLIWPRIDSLYFADSTAVAKAKFEAWYAGLTKAERKR